MIARPHNAEEDPDHEWHVSSAVHRVAQLSQDPVKPEPATQKLDLESSQQEAQERKVYLSKIDTN